MPQWRTRGQPTALAAIARMAASGQVPHALLLSGPAGSGKTTLALDLAAALLCAAVDPAARPCRGCPACRRLEHGNHPDLHRLAPSGAGRQVRIGDRLAPEPGTVRSLIRDLALAPAEGGWRVAVVEDADRLNEDAQHALLKLLEEPPPATVLVLCAADEELLLPTVRSRCVRVRLGPVPADAIAALLIGAGIADAPRAGTLARLAEGRPGIALALAGSPETVVLEQRLERELLDLARRGRAERIAAAADLFRSGDGLAALLGPAEGGGSSGSSVAVADPASGAADAAEAVETGGAAGTASAASTEAAAAARGSRARARREPASDAAPDSARDRQSPASRRRAVLALGTTWRSVARDVALASRGARAELRHVDLLEEIVAVAAACPPGAAERFLVRLDVVLRAVEQNANPELALDTLLLAWPKVGAA